MSDMGVRQAADDWGYAPTTIQKWCREGKIPNATQDKKGAPWHIPKDAVCPKPVKKTKSEK